MLVEGLSLANVPGNLGHFLVHSRWPGEIAHQMALVPLVWLAFLYRRGLRPGAHWWFLALAFGISWLADTWADLAPHQAWAASLVYPVSQCALVGAVLLPRRRDAWVFLGILVAIALITALWLDGHGPDDALRTFAFLGIFWIVFSRPELPNPLRWSLMIYFGAGWAFWMWHVHVLTVPTWYPYQVCRLFGLALFCRAAVNPVAPLRLVSRYQLSNSRLGLMF